jgi:hypothetical protein
MHYLLPLLLLIKKCTQHYTNQMYNNLAILILLLIVNVKFVILDVEVVNKFVDIML